MTQPCTHDFIKVRSLETEVPESTQWQHIVVVVCAYCGQVRHVHEDGKIEVVNEHGKTSHTSNS
jgi:hypothetical protein